METSLTRSWKLTITDGFAPLALLAPCSELASWLISAGCDRAEDA